MNVFKDKQQLCAYTMDEPLFVLRMGPGFDPNPAPYASLTRYNVKITESAHAPTCF